MDAPENPRTWDPVSVSKWLRNSFDLPDSTIDLFIDNEVDGQVLLEEFDHGVLKDEFGISSFGKRCKILQQIRTLQEKAYSLSTEVSQAPPTRINSSEESPALPGIIDVGGVSLTDLIITSDRKQTDRRHESNRHEEDEVEPIPLLEKPLQIWRYDSLHTEKKQNGAWREKQAADDISLGDSDEEDWDDDHDEQNSDLDGDGYQEERDNDGVGNTALTIQLSKTKDSQSAGVYPTLISSGNGNSNELLPTPKRIAPTLMSAMLPARTSELAPDILFTSSTQPSNAHGSQGTPTTLLHKGLATMDMNMDSDTTPDLISQPATSTPSTSSANSGASTVKRIAPTLLSPVPPLDSSNPLTKLSAKGSVKRKDNLSPSTSYRSGAQKQPYLSHVGMALRDIFFNKDGSALESDSDDEWSMVSTRSRRKSMHKGYRTIVQRNLRRILRQPPIFEIQGHVVYAPIRRKTKDVPVRVLSPSGSAKESMVSTSSWDSLFKDDKQTKSMLRTEIELNDPDLTSIDFRALTGGVTRAQPAASTVEDDPIYPLYGDSDASAYTTDEELYKEVGKEERERLKQKPMGNRTRTSNAMLSKETVQEIAEQYMIDRVSEWVRGPQQKAEKNRHRTFQQLTNQEQQNVDRLTNEIKTLSEKRMKSIMDAIVDTPYRTSGEVRKACKAMDETVDLLQLSRWKLDLINGPPPSPPSEMEPVIGSEHQESISKRRERAASLGSLESEEMMDLIEERRQRHLDDDFIDDSEMLEDAFPGNDWTFDDTLSGDTLDVDVNGNVTVDNPPEYKQGDFIDGSSSATKDKPANLPLGVFETNDEPKLLSQASPSPSTTTSTSDKVPRMSRAEINAMHKKERKRNKKKLDKRRRKDQVRSTAPLIVIDLDEEMTGEGDLSSWSARSTSAEPLHRSKKHGVKVKGRIQDAAASSTNQGHTFRDTKSLGVRLPPASGATDTSDASMEDVQMAEIPIDDVHIKIDVPKAVDVDDSQVNVMEASESQANVAPIEDTDEGSEAEADMLSSELETTQPAPPAQYKPCRIPDWRRKLQDDDLLIKEISSIRVQMSRGIDVYNREPFVSAFHEYIEWMELDCGDSLSFREFLKWKDQGNDTRAYRMKAQAVAAAQAAAEKAAARVERRIKSQEARAAKKKQSQAAEKAEGERKPKTEEEERVVMNGQTEKNGESIDAQELKDAKTDGEITLKRKKHVIAIDTDSEVTDDEPPIAKPRTKPNTAIDLDANTDDDEPLVMKSRTVRDKDSSYSGSHDSRESTSNQSRTRTLMKRTKEKDSNGGKRKKEADDSDLDDEGGDMGIMTPLSLLNFQKRPKTARHNFELEELESSADDEDRAEETQPATKRKQPKAMIDDTAEVVQLRKDAERNELELQKRIKEQEHRGQLRSSMGNLEEDEILINPGHKKTERGVAIPAFIAKKLKPHQVDGVRFLWKNVVMFDGGCILAHSMGLGKTFQVVSFLYVLLREIQAGNKDIPKKLQAGRVLLLMPPTVVQNWADEIDKWIPVEEREVAAVYRLPLKDRTTAKRLSTLENWHTKGGILLIGYEMFRELCTVGARTSQLAPDITADVLKRFQELLLKGTSLAIADEGHAIKNSVAKLAITCNKLTTSARVILTGYPLQNRLEEYWCMVDFVRPKYLGELPVFRNNYIRPIAMGLYPDSSASEKKVSSKKLKVLTELIKNFVMRKDQSVLRASLPRKVEFVVSCKLSTMQYFLYTATLKKSMKASSTRPTADAMQKLPGEAPTTATKDDGNVIVIGDDAVEVDERDIEHALLANKEVIDKHWSSDIIDKESVSEIRHSHKFMILMDILHECRAIKEKVLVFSRSIPTIDFIEYATNKEGFRSMKLDGSTPIGDRQDMINEFNNTENYDFFLVSSGSGSQGVNLVSASRVVIFDVGWNPSHDEQAIARAFRYGQTRKVFVYRLQTYGTWEDKLYKTNLHKLGLSNRVVDKKNTRKAFTKTEMSAYFEPPPTPLLTPEWATDVNVQELFDKPDTEDVVLRKVIEKNERAITSILLQSDLVREEVSDLTEADMIEIQSMIHEEEQRINMVGTPHLPPQSSLNLPVTLRPQLQPQLQPQGPGQPSGQPDEAAVALLQGLVTHPNQASAQTAQVDLGYATPHAKQAAWMAVAQAQAFAQSRANYLARHGLGSSADGTPKPMPMMSTNPDVQAAGLPWRYPPPPPPISSPAHSNRVVVSMPMDNLNLNSYQYGGPIYRTVNLLPPTEAPRYMADNPSPTVVAAQPTGPMQQVNFSSRAQPQSHPSVQEGPSIVVNELQQQQQQIQQQQPRPQEEKELEHEHVQIMERMHELVRQKRQQQEDTDSASIDLTADDRNAEPSSQSIVQQT
ncbi:hypothetical protein BGZ51_007577 [Haplosporangium sp. Z 767]|nr:hypothetical protein BGZ51_007577 [Haplosporangium sp. Z 767]KAF9191707.1 hypothetical protein BGZ50_009180 [Haplosporangium sp. Z 11]